MSDELRILRSLRDTYRRRCDAAAMQTVRTELLAAVTAAQDALADHDEQVAKAPAALADVERRLSEHDKAAQLVRSREAAKLLATLEAAKTLQAELASTPAGREALAKLGLL